MAVLVAGSVLLTVPAGASTATTVPARPSVPAPSVPAPADPAPADPAPDAAAGPVDAPPAPGPDTGSEELRAQVADLTSQVDALDVQAEVAFEDWNEVQAELDTLMAREVAAQVSLDDAGQALQADRAAASRRVRALYRTGGATEIAWTAFAGSGSGFAQAAQQYKAARVVLDSDAATVVRARDRVAVAVSSSAEVQELRRQRTALEAEAEVRHRTAEAALSARKALLATADAQLAETVERERVEAERVALEQALAAAAERAAQAAAVARADALALLSPEARAQALAQDSAGAAGPGGGPVRAGTVGSDVQAVIDRAAAGASSPTAAAAIRLAASRLGLPYTWGATGPGTFDCSGLTMWAYAQAGARIPRTSRQQYAGLPRVPVAELLPGDLVFYAHGSDPGSIHHVSIWLGDGLILTAPRTGDVVKVSPVWRQPLYGAVRVPG